MTKLILIFFMFFVSNISYSSKFLKGNDRYIENIVKQEVAKSCNINTVVRNIHNRIVINKYRINKVIYSKNTYTLIIFKNNKLNSIYMIRKC